MEKELNINELEPGDWVFIGSQVTKLTITLIKGNPRNVRDIALCPELLTQFGFVKAFDPCDDGSYNWWVESPPGSKMGVNLTQSVVGGEGVTHKGTCSVRILQHVVRTYHQRYPHHDGEFSFLLRKIDKIIKNITRQ